MAVLKIARGLEVEMKLGLAFVVMGFGFMGCASIDWPAMVTAPAEAPVTAQPVKTVNEPAAIEINKATLAESTAEDSAEKSAAPLNKEQCSNKFPVVVGGLALRQQCVNDSATGSMSQFTAKQQVIISDCADKLLALAERADRGDVAFDAYKTEKQKLRETCNTSIRMAGGTAAKAGPTKAAPTKSSATKTTTTKTTTTTSTK
jgi:hypothetical protein